MYMQMMLCMWVWVWVWVCVCVHMRFPQHVYLPVFVAVPDGQGFVTRFNQPYSMIDVGGPGGVGLMVGAVGLQSFPLDFLSESRPIAAHQVSHSQKSGQSGVVRTKWDLVT